MSFWLWAHSWVSQPSSSSHGWPSAISWPILCLLIAIQLSHYHLDASQYRAEHSWVSPAHQAGTLSLAKPWNNLCELDEHQPCGRDLRDSSHSQARRSLSSGPLWSLESHNSIGWPLLPLLISWRWSVTTQSSMMASISVGFVPPSPLS